MENKENAKNIKLYLMCRLCEIGNSSSTTTFEQTLMDRDIIILGQRRSRVL